jgi:hypothetical protein
MPKPVIVDKEIVKESTPEKTTYHFVNTVKSIDFRSKICFNRMDKFTVFPFYIDRNTNEPKNKYSKIESITFEGFKGKIPGGFLRQPQRGYGFTRYLSPLKRFVEDNFRVADILISRKEKTGVKNRTLILNYRDLEDVRKGLSSIIRDSRETSSCFLGNYFSRFFPAIFQRRHAEYKGGTITRILKQYTSLDRHLSIDDRNALFELFNKLSLSRKDIFGKQELIKTREIIEKKFIEDILKQFERNLKLKRIGEQRWQEFFKDNSWIFSQLFAYPTVFLKEKAYVGGKSIQDTDGRIVDFLFINKLTKNSAIIEIKKHTSSMYGKRPYRGSSAFALNKELSGAISQVLDQKDTYLKKFESIRSNEITAFNPKCLVIIGKISDLNEDQAKSFELLRTALKDVEIITFDELYERIKAILGIFSHET